MVSSILPAKMALINGHLHSSIDALLSFCWARVRSQRNNDRPFAFSKMRPNTTRRLISINYGHLTVHQDNTVLSLLTGLHRFQAIVELRPFQTPIFATCALLVRLMALSSGEKHSRRFLDA